MLFWIKGNIVQGHYDVNCACAILAPRFFLTKFPLFPRVFPTQKVDELKSKAHKWHSLASSAGKQVYL